MDCLELISFNIISAVGTAKSNYVEAMRAAERGDFDLAKQKIKDGETIFVKGHEAHASLIQKEASGESVVPNILLMHAEDQLMSAETIKIMAEEIIKLSQRLYTLENQ
ncbi:MAG: PTS lactose/cellobiose transporter subunit IIA [Coprobacillus sp.]